MDELVFTKALDNRIYPHKQLAYSYFIADYRAMTDACEVRPITIGHLLYALGRNYGRIIYWSFLRLLYRCKFIDIPIASSFSWRHHFRWCFWEPLIFRTPEVE